MPEYSASSLACLRVHSACLDVLFGNSVCVETAGEEGFFTTFLSLDDIENKLKKVFIRHYLFVRKWFFFTKKKKIYLTMVRFQMQKKSQ